MTWYVLYPTGQHTFYWKTYIIITIKFVLYVNQTNEEVPLFDSHCNVVLIRCKCTGDIREGKAVPHLWFRK